MEVRLCNYIHFFTFLTEFSTLVNKFSNSNIFSGNKMKENENFVKKIFKEMLKEKLHKMFCGF